jgi:hypothetical protein
MIGTEHYSLADEGLVGLVADGGEIKIHGRTLGEAFAFFNKDAKFATLLLEGVLAERAFYDVGSVRFDVLARRTSILHGDWTLLTRVGGIASAQLSANWARGEGALITCQAHRYLLATAKRPQTHTIVRREVGDRRLMTVSSPGFPSLRRVAVHPTEIELEEFHLVLATVIFYLSVVENALATAG